MSKTSSASQTKSASKSKHTIDAGMNGLDAFFQNTSTASPEAGNPKARTGEIREANTREKKASEEKTVVSLRMPGDVADLLNEVYGHKYMKDNSIQKGEMAADLLRPVLKAELIKLLKEEQERLMNMDL